MCQPDSPRVCLGDYENEAKKRLDRRAKDYYFTGAGDEESLRQNETAFQRLLLRWRTLRGIDGVDLSTTVQGRRWAFPVGVAPSAAQKLAHADGELATARACARAGTGMVLSTFSTHSVEEVALGASDGVRWLQLYMGNNRHDTAQHLVERAKRNGFSAIAVTVDCPQSGKRHAEARNPFSLPENMSLANFDPAYCQLFSSAGKGKIGLREMAEMLGDEMRWADLDWLVSIADLPVIAKGIMTAEDALEAVRHGAQGVWVSNHGARQLDTTPATIEVLPEIVAAVGNKVEVYLDGGVRCGTDVLKALALGCRAVFVGRPALWGLACDGEDGVYHILEILKDELALALRITGCRDVTDFPSDLVAHVDRYRARL